MWSKLKLRGRRLPASRTLLGAPGSPWVAPGSQEAEGHVEDPGNTAPPRWRSELRWRLLGCSLGLDLQKCGFARSSASVHLPWLWIPARRMRPSEPETGLIRPTRPLPRSPPRLAGTLAGWRADAASHSPKRKLPALLQKRQNTMPIPSWPSPGTQPGFLLTELISSSQNKETQLFTIDPYIMVTLFTADPYYGT